MACKIYEALTNNGVDCDIGAVVRISGNNQFVAAQADSSAHALGTIGVTSSHVAGGQIGNVITFGKAPVQLEDGLTPVAGQTLWLSATTLGRATNVKPAIAVEIGVIKDASPYVTVVNPFVVADISVKGGVGVTSQKIDLSGATTVSSNAGAEETVLYWYVDFSVLPSANVAFKWDFTGWRDAGAGNPNARLRLGGVLQTDGTLDTSGALLSGPFALPDNAAAFPETGTFANPGGQQFVAVTINTSGSGGATGFVQGTTIQLVAA